MHWSVAADLEGYRYPGRRVVAASRERVGPFDLIGAEGAVVNGRSISRIHHRGGRARIAIDAAVNVERGGANSLLAELPVANLMQGRVEQPHPKKGAGHPVLDRPRRIGGLGRI